LRGLLDSLRASGFLAGPLPPGMLPRRLHPTPDPESCLGKRIGLERAEIFEVRGDGSCFRFGTTVPELSDLVRSAFGAVAPGDDPAETFVARISPVRGKVARTQQLFDSLGNVLYAGRDEDRCAEALRRTLSARAALDRGGVWVEGPALLSERGVVLLHPAIGHEAVGPMRRELGDRGIEFVPSAFLELISPMAVRLPADVVAHASAVELPLRALVVPDDPGAHSLERLVLASARRLDRAHLDSFIGLVGAGQVVAIPQGLTVVEIVEMIAAVTGRSGR
jgi:hypothetical protein